MRDKGYFSFEKVCYYVANFTQVVF